LLVPPRVIVKLAARIVCGTAEEAQKL